MASLPKRTSVADATNGGLLETRSELGSRLRRLVHDNGAFTLSFLGLLVWKWASFPYLFRRSEFIWEEGKDLFMTAHQESFWEGLFKPDFVYLTVLGRLVSYLVEILPIERASIPKTYHLMSLALVSVGQAAVALPVFRRLIPKDILRVFLAFALGIPGLQMGHLLINVAYAWVPFFFMALCCADAWNQRGRTIPVLVSLWLALLALSKGTLLCLAPAVLVATVAAVAAREWKTVRFLALPLAGFIAQGLFVLLKGRSSEDDLLVFGLGTLVWSTLVFALQFLNFAMLGSFSLHFPTVSLVLTSTILPLGLVRWMKALTGTGWQETLLKRVGSPSFLGALVVLVFAFSLNGTFLTMSRFATVPGSFPSTRSIFTNENEQTLLQCMLPIGVLWVAGFHLAANLMNRRRRAALVWLIFTVWLGSVALAIAAVHRGTVTDFPVTGFGDWQSFSNALDTREFCAPSNSFPGVLGRCKVVIVPDSESDWKRAPVAASSSGYPIPAGLPEARVLWVGFLLQDEDRTRSIRLEFLDPRGVPIRSVEPVSPNLGYFTLFRVPADLRGIGRLRLMSRDGGAVRIRMSSWPLTPTWIWAASNEPLDSDEREQFVRETPAGTSQDLRGLLQGRAPSLRPHTSSRLPSAVWSLSREGQKFILPLQIPQGHWYNREQATWIERKNGFLLSADRPWQEDSPVQAAPFIRFRAADVGFEPGSEFSLLFSAERARAYFSEQIRLGVQIGSMPRPHWYSFDLGPELQTYSLPLKLDADDPEPWIGISIWADPSGEGRRAVIGPFRLEKITPPLRRD